MKLMTKAIEKQFAKYPIGSQDGMDVKKVIVKFFNPYGAGTWFATEGEQMDNGDWEFFGFVELLDREWGYFTLSELQSITSRWAGGRPSIERDIYTAPKYIDFNGNEVDEEEAKERIGKKMEIKSRGKYGISVMDEF